MGSDSSPVLLFSAVIQAAEDLGADDSLIVFATSPVIKEIQSEGNIPSVIHFHAVTQEITMEDDPLKVVRRKKDASIPVGISLLKDQQIDAFVSAGNTGALITSATLLLPMLPNIKRPALLAVLPSLDGSVAVIDVGGNVSCKSEHLLQFVQMGIAYQRSVLGIDHPRVGLLNIGVESGKGTPELRDTYQALQQSNVNFIGNVEGRDVFNGKIDVLITDGFTGNVLLKGSEGISSFIFDYLQRALANESSETLHSALNVIQNHFDYAEYPGAIVCGVDGIVVKCHGDSSPKAVLSGIRGAITLVQNNLIKNIHSQL